MRSDWNDLHTSQGLDAVRDQLLASMEAMGEALTDLSLVEACLALFKSVSISELVAKRRVAVLKSARSSLYISVLL